MNEPLVVNASGETTGVLVVPAPRIEAAPSTVTKPTAVTEAMVPVEGAEALATDTAIAADGDEGTLYGTDRYTGDAADDGLTGGDEPFVAARDPLTGNTDGDGETALA